MSPVIATTPRRAFTPLRRKERIARQRKLLHHVARGMEFEGELAARLQRPLPKTPVEISQQIVKWEKEVGRANIPDANKDRLRATLLRVEQNAKRFLRLQSALHEGKTTPHELLSKILPQIKLKEKSTRLILRALRSRTLESHPLDVHIDWLGIHIVVSKKYEHALRRALDDTGQGFAGLSEPSGRIRIKNKGRTISIYRPGLSFSFTYDENPSDVRTAQQIIRHERWHDWQHLRNSRKEKVSENHLGIDIQKLKKGKITQEHMNQITRTLDYWFRKEMASHILAHENMKERVSDYFFDISRELFRGPKRAKQRKEFEQLRQRFIKIVDRLRYLTSRYAGVNKSKRYTPAALAGIVSKTPTAILLRRLSDYYARGDAVFTKKAPMELLDKKVE